MSRVMRLALCLSLLFSTAAGQKQSTSGKASAAAAYKLIALKVTGTARYTDKEILAASGLQMGQNAADGDFKEAVQRLGDSGLFSNVVYSYSSSDTGVRLELQLADADQSKRFPRNLKTSSGSPTTNCAPPCNAAFRCSSSCCPLQAIFRTGFPRRCRSCSPRSIFPGG